MKNIVLSLHSLVYVGGAILLVLHGHPCFAVLLLMLTPCTKSE